MEDKVITIYHGSTKEIQKPLFGVGSPDNDYGSGFYTTLIPEKADAWAVAMGKENSGVTNVYNLNLEGLNVVNLNEYGMLTWIATILSNRGVKDAFHQLKAELLVEKYAIDLSDADVIIGYRADDSYMDIVEWFLDDKLDISDVQKLFQKGELGVQYFIKSEKAFERIVFVNSYNVEFKEELLSDERNARKEVSRFMDNRSRAVILEKLKISGITSTEAIDYDFKYDKETDSYYVKSREVFGYE